jgi:hypothetical protein
VTPQDAQTKDAQTKDTQTKDTQTEDVEPGGESPTDRAADVTLDLADPTAFDPAAKSLASGLAGAVGTAAGGSMASGAASVPAAAVVGFRPGRIIDDKVFTATGTMSVAAISNFIAGKVATCKSGYTCLEDFRQNTRARAADQWCKGYAAGTRESAATIIYKTAQSCGINPQVLLVMLEKEQGLVTHTWPSDWRFTIAMGMGCPDTADCDTQFYGFQNQVYGAARQMKIYAGDDYFNWYPVGRTSQVRYHPNASCGSSGVLIESQSTANLYFYTPYQPNAAALAAGAGTGNSCSSYGNRNFYRYFTAWFGSTLRTDPCTVPATSAATWTYALTKSVTGRTAPNTSCATGAVSLAAGTVAQATAVTADDAWLRLRTASGERWVPRSAVREATGAERPCALPAGIRTASWTYVVGSAGATGRGAPHTGCKTDTVAYAAGTTAQAVAATADGSWLRLRTGSGLRWVPLASLRHATVAEATCAHPDGARTLSGVYVVRTGGATGRTGPDTRCTMGSASLKVWTVAQAVKRNANSTWIQLRTPSGLLWVPSDRARPATSAEAACVHPSGATAHGATYVVQAGAVGRLGPSTACAAQAASIPAPTVAVATAATSTFVRLRTPWGERWIDKAHLKAATTAQAACATPADVRTATYAYRVVGAATGRVGPAATCAFGAEGIAAGSIVKAVATTADLSQRLVRTEAGYRWVPIGALRTATSAEAPCAYPSGVVAIGRAYVVRAGALGRIGPSSQCTTGSRSVPLSTVALATAQSADGRYLRMSTPVGEVWIHRDRLRAATAAEAVCAYPADAGSATWTYTLTTAAVGRVGPATACAYGAVTLARGTTAKAVATSPDGAWRLLDTSAGLRWVAVTQLRGARS